MKVVILDSDGLIKLAKAGVINELSQGYLFLTTKQVYNEVAIKGKAYGHADAVEIEEMIKERVIQVFEIPSPKGDIRLGEGERSCFHLFKRESGGFIVSDDQAFLRYLEFHQIPFIIPTDLIVAAVLRGIISVGKAKMALGKIRSVVRKENLKKAAKKLEEIK